MLLPALQAEVLGDRALALIFLRSAAGTGLAATLLGLAVPVANLLWAFVGRERPSTLKEKLLTSLHGRLALGLVAGLALFFAVHALIYSRIVPGDGAWTERMTAGLNTAWAGGGGAGNTDPETGSDSYELESPRYALIGQGTGVSSWDPRGTNVQWFTALLESYASARGVALLDAFRMEHLLPHGGVLFEPLQSAPVHSYGVTGRGHRLHPCSGSG